MTLPENNRTLAAVITVLMLTLATGALAQDSLRLDPIQVIARPSADSITLRWAPMKKEYWMDAIRYGYTVERFTVVRNGKVATQNERKTLVAAARPLPEAEWARYTRNKYAMIAAQAVYGEAFELNIQQSDVM